jgi:adenosylcobinamide-GDP ribazoletransferase
MNLGDYADDLARSIGFLSRVPMPGRFFRDHDGSLSRACGMFPVAGLLIALPAAAAFSILLTLHVEPLLAAFVVLGVQTLITGALHEDGLSDTADGIGGGRTRERILEIMRDSRIGSYGASALVLSYGIRAAGLLSLGSHLGPTAAGFSVVAVAAVSRAAMVWHWSMLPQARRDGVAASVGMPEQSAVKLALATAAVATVLVAGPAAGLLAVALVLLVTGLATYGLTHYIGSKIGGHTGDTIGAAQQIAEMAALFALALAV